MPKNKRKFIDKSKAITFNLVHRSQKDPLVTDDKAPQHVLQPVKDKKRDEREKYGIYYDDDYDYMQHLKPRTGEGELILVEQPAMVEKRGTKNIELPSSVFQSNIEEKVGVLNKAAPQSGLNLDLDPDIVAAMDDDFDFSDPENMLEDNFMELANGGGSFDGSDMGSDIGSDFMASDEEEEEKMMVRKEEEDEVESLNGFDTKSRFTEYSMTSSVIRRNEQLTLLDDKFEEMFAEYDNSEIGPLECEEIEGVMDPTSDILLEYADKFEKERKPETLKLEHTVIPSDSDSSDSEGSIIEVKEKPQWDCQSILSCNSTLYNHPKVIDAPPSKIKVNPRTGIPEVKTKLTASALAKLNNGSDNKATGPGSLVSIVSTLSIRPENETPLERVKRKKAFREYKMGRRIERKLNTQAFKDEKVRMQKMMAHNKSQHIVHI